MQNLVQIESVFSFAAPCYRRLFVTSDNRVHPTAICLVTANNRVQTRRQYYAQGTFIENVEQNLNFLVILTKILGKTSLFGNFVNIYGEK